MNRIKFAVAVTGFGLALSNTSRAADTGCLEYEPSMVTLSGEIVRYMEYGAPGYGEDPARDEKEFYWYLDVDRPLCVNGKDEDSPNMVSEDDVRRLQIVFWNGYPGQRKDWVWHRATIIGTLFHSDNGHHHTDVLVQVQSITKK